MANTNNTTKVSEPVRGTGGSLTDIDNRHVRYAHDDTGNPKWVDGGNVASASTIFVPDDSNACTVTGTTNITAIGGTTGDTLTTLDVGMYILCKFSGDLNMIHSSNFVMPKAVDLSITAGDIVTFRHYELGKWEVVSYHAESAGQAGQGAYESLAITNNVTNPTFQVDVDAASVTLTDTNGVEYKATSVSLTADITTSGVAGLDTGAEAPSTFYFIWIISTGDTDALLLSLSSTAPTLPGSYIYKRRIGGVYNSSTSNFHIFEQIGNNVHLTKGTSFLLAGAAGAYALVTPTEVPSTANLLYLEAWSTTSSNTDFRLGTDGITHDRLLFIHYDSSHLWMRMTSANQIYYIRQSGTGTLNLITQGWIDNI